MQQAHSVGSNPAYSGISILENDEAKFDKVLLVCYQTPDDGGSDGLRNFDYFQSHGATHSFILRYCSRNAICAVLVKVGILRDIS
jgi:hypothetical protein